MGAKGVVWREERSRGQVAQPVGEKRSQVEVPAFEGNFRTGKIVEKK